MNIFCVGGKKEANEITHEQFMMTPLYVPSSALSDLQYLEKAGR